MVGAERETGGPDDVEEILTAAARAPSSHNSQPWDLRWSDGALEVRGDPTRTLPVSDPDGRELRLACGAALVNARTVIRAGGHRAHIRLLPDHDDPWLVGRVRVGSALRPAPHELDLAAAVWRRRTDRGAFRDAPLGRELRHALGQAARREQVWLVFVDDPADRRALREIAGDAHRAQQRDPAFRAEWNHWIGHDRATDDGLPADLARHAPVPDGRWRLRDFGEVGDVARPRRVTPVEPEPTVAVVATFHDTPLAQVQAGMGMQEVLLTATVRRSAASFLASPLELPEYRRRVRDLVGGGLQAQMVLRLGYGGAGVAPPRRSVGTTAPPYAGA